ncbi:TetR/AcrR family transcriptional regulator [Patulibacter defluvii]|uniref:TetR/AcrR family transcriptional regulator n=1 Tax=Patulibacter defluvii TaxID=3095358 RepID=UPI002A74A538|nr:helix-turn-helix domain-containing protein [Patulibacter sp. DM4]
MSEPSAPRRRLPRADRRRQLLDAALAEFAERGYAAASMNAIAERAGITKPLLYRHFDSKDGLFAACQQEVGEALVTAVEGAMAAAPRSLELPARVVGAVLAALEPDPRRWAILTDRTIPLDGPVGAGALRYVGRLRELAGEGIGELLGAAGLEDADDRDAATAAWIAIVTAAVEWWLVHPGTSAAAMEQRVLRILRALRAAPA